MGGHPLQLPKAIALQQAAQRASKYPGLGLPSSVTTAPLYAQAHPAHVMAADWWLMPWQALSTSGIPGMLACPTL